MHATGRRTWTLAMRIIAIRSCRLDPRLYPRRESKRRKGLEEIGRSKLRGKASQNLSL